MQKIRLLIINPNTEGISSMTGMSSLFAPQDHFQVVGEISKIPDERFVRQLQPDVILYRLTEDNESLTSLIVDLKKICPYSMVIVFSSHDKDSLVLDSFLSGADGFIKAPILPADLVTALELSCRSRVCFFPRAAKEWLFNYNN